MTSTQIAESAPIALVNTVDAPVPLRAEVRGDGSVVFQACVAAGLYQLSAVLDGSDFDWEALYEVLSKYDNVDERTGPWDFSINHGNRPLVPTYWVSVNGTEIGPWYFERISLDDLSHRRFRGNAAFYLDGDCEIALQPFRRFSVHWQGAVFERDPQDHLLPSLPPLNSPETSSLAARWAEPEFWESLKQGLAGGGLAAYDTPVRTAIAWVNSKAKHIGRSLHERIPAQEPQDLLILLAAHKLYDEPMALQHALEVIDRAVAKPAWGNPNRGAYGHNGDMGAMVNLLWLALAYHAFGHELGAARRRQMLDKLQLQGELFFHLLLLHRDYWGGSIAQDHGWKSLFGFGTTALHLLGLVPAAERWVRFCIPRLRRSLSTMPPDGIIPRSSHNSIWLYLHEVTLYRDTLLALSGEDIFDRAPVRAIVDYLAVTRAAAPVELIGGLMPLNRIAQKFHDGRAARLAQLPLSVPEFHFGHPCRTYAYYLGLVEGLLSATPAVTPIDAIPPAPPLVYFEDAGMVEYRHASTAARFTVQCGPCGGYTQYRRAPGSCDRLGYEPKAGHFTLDLADLHLLTTPPGGYSLRAETTSSMLVDGKGQVDDVGYPMSIPSHPHAGEQIEAVHWEEATQTGFVRLNLKRAYPETAQLARYTRDFLLGPGPGISCRDVVVCDGPKRLTWQFQANALEPIEEDADRGFRIGGERPLQLQAMAAGLELRTSMADTHVVWSYSGDHTLRFRRLCFDTVEPVTFAVVDFRLSWPHAAEPACVPARPAPPPGQPA